jgi:membrane protein
MQTDEMLDNYALPPIPGRPIDPPTKPAPEKIRRLAERPGALGSTAALGLRFVTRISRAKIGLLAAGTTYYLFLALFAVAAFAYGLAATLGTDVVTEWLNEAIENAFPGLLGPDGLDPDQLRAVGQATSIVGSLALLYAGLGGVGAAHQSIHKIYGAPVDARNFVVAKLRFVGWLLILGPLIMLSFVTSSLTSTLSTRILELVGIDSNSWQTAIQWASILLAFILNFAIVFLLLSHFGGIRPDRTSLIVGSVFGAVVVELLKTLMASLIAYTVERPQYGALAAPIGILFVFFLLSTALYISAALTAAVADRERPLHHLLPAPDSQEGSEGFSASEAPDSAEAPVSPRTPGAPAST